MLHPSTNTLLRASSRAKQLSSHLSTASVPSSSVFSKQGSTTSRMASQSTKLKLNTGAEIPAIGFGTWQDPDAQESSVLTALKAGYRHIDGARM